MATVAGIQSYFSFFDYFGKLSGNEQRTFNNRSLAFLFSQVPADDFPAQPQLIPLRDGLEVLSGYSKQDAYYWLVIQQL
jgi:hypothetical protein